MALDNNTVTYTGKEAQEWYSSAIYNGGSIGKLTVMPNVKSKIQLPALSLNGLVSKESGCDFSDSGTVSISDAELVVDTMKINKELCTSDFEGIYLSEQLRPGSNGAQVPENFNGFLLEKLAEYAASEVESMAWSSTTTDLTNGGFVYQLENGSPVGLTGSTLTSANIISELKSIVSNIPSGLKFRKGNDTRYSVKLFMNAASSDLYRMADPNSQRVDFTSDVPLTFMGYEIVPAPVADGVIVAAEPLNLVVGCDLLEDIEDIKVIDMSETTGDDKTRFKARMKVGAAIRGIGEVVYRKNA